MTAGPRRLRDLDALVRAFIPGESVFLQGAGGEVDTLVDRLCAFGAPLALTGAFLPGVNPVPASQLPAGSTFTNLFAQSDRAGAQDAGALRTLPLTYAGFAAHLRERPPFDVCVLHVSPPDEAGRCSLGVAVEFALLAAQNARRLVGVVNARMPRVPKAGSLPFAGFDRVVECDLPLRRYEVGAPGAAAQAIARHVAAFVDDGAALQIGLGKAPDALMRLLADRRGLRLFSGMLSDGARDLVEAGAVDPAFEHTGCMLLGSQDFYDWLPERRDFAVRGCDVTHDVARLAALDRFVAVNSALTVDLFGQANLETLGGRMISGVGGAPDFARGAKLSKGGVSIVALAATGGRDEASRIVATLDAPCSLGRADIDVVVTEHGAADLRGRSIVERARRMTAIAAPGARAALEQAAHDLAKRL